MRKDSGGVARRVVRSTCTVAGMGSTLVRPTLAHLPKTTTFCVVESDRNQATLESFFRPRPSIVCDHRSVASKLHDESCVSSLPIVKNTQITLHQSDCSTSSLSDASRSVASTVSRQTLVGFTDASRTVASDTRVDMRCSPSFPSDYIDRHKRVHVETVHTGSGTRSPSSEQAGLTTPSFKTKPSYASASPQRAPGQRSVASMLQEYASIKGSNFRSSGIDVCLDINSEMSHQEKRAESKLECKDNTNAALVVFCDALKERSPATHTYKKRSRIDSGCAGPYFESGGIAELLRSI